MIRPFFIHLLARLRPIDLEQLHPHPVHPWEACECVPKRADWNPAECFRSIPDMHGKNRKGSHLNSPFPPWLSLVLSMEKPHQSQAPLNPLGKWLGMYYVRQMGSDSHLTFTQDPPFRGSIPAVCNIRETIER